MEGVKQLKKSELEPRVCFIQPPDMATLEQRLRETGGYEGGGDRAEVGAGEEGDGVLSDGGEGG